MENNLEENSDCIAVTSHHALLSVNRPSNLDKISARRQTIELGWEQEGIVDNFIVYWKTESGTEYNISTQTNRTTIYLQHPSLTPATVYYISVAAVRGGSISERSETIYEGTGRPTI